MTQYHREPTLAISLFGPGVVFADWVKDLLKNDDFIIMDKKLLLK